MIYFVFLFLISVLAFLARYNFFRPTKKGIVVLLYHRIDDEKLGNALDKFSISLQTFENHVRKLKNKGFLCAHPGNIEDIVKKKLYMNNRYVMFTFDDGYKDNVKAAEILSRHGYSGIFFISTAYIGSTHQNAKMVDDKDLRKLVEMGMYLGSHSHEHLMLSKLSPREIENQVNKSLEILSRFQPVFDFAYPFGDVSEAVIKVIDNLGFKRAYIIGQKIYQPEVHARLRIPRCIIRKDTNNIDFYLIITRGRSKF